MLVEMLFVDGRTVEGLALVDDLLVVVDEKNHRQYEAELHRLRRQLLLLRASGEAEHAMRRAASVGVAQGAVSFDLRACMCLVRFHEGTDRSDQAISELRDTYENFDEGFTTEDLVAAHALIEAPTMQ